jgi:hypothetical protein
MRDPVIIVFRRSVFASLLVLSATGWVAEVPATVPRQVLTLEDGAVVARDSSGSVRRLLETSPLLRKHKVHSLLDWKDLQSRRATRLLLTVGEPSQPGDMHTPAGRELWQVDSDGAERLVAADVFQARLSPGGEALLYVTTSRAITVQKSDGRVLLQIPRGYGPTWSSDGHSIVLSLADETSALNMPEGMRISTVDLVTGRTRDLTDGFFDDTRPHFDPSGRWILFVSGARSGLASFWRVWGGGGDPIQLTNVGATDVDERYVPTPYKRTLWSMDGRWFLYDFKLGAREEVWGLEFSPSGDFVRALKIADGLDPQWLDSGASVVVQTTIDGLRQPVVTELPQ